MDYLWQQRHSSSDLLGTVINVHNGDWIRRGKLLTAQQVLREYQIFRIPVLYWICHLEDVCYFFFNECLSSLLVHVLVISFCSDCMYVFFIIQELWSYCSLFTEAGVGAGTDSYYEYVLKAYILLGDEKYLYRFDRVSFETALLLASSGR